MTSDHTSSVCESFIVWSSIRRGVRMVSLGRHGVIFPMLP
jgi:hypothetical protein